MIGLVMRSVLGDSLGLVGSICAPLIAVAAICGVIQCCNCRMRDCRCIKHFLRSVGADEFDDFEIMILVHQVQFTSRTKQHTYVKITAGDQTVQTDSDHDGVFQQALQLLVEQGAQEIRFELCCLSGSVLAELKMDVLKDILRVADGDGVLDKVLEKTFNMKQKAKGVLNPRLKLTFSPEGQGEEEKALLSGINASSETEWMLQQQLTKVETKDTEGAPLSELELLAKGCSGPLEMFTKFGKKTDVYVAVLGPPRKKKYALHIWSSERDCNHGKAPLDTIEILRVKNVSPDPGRGEVFVLVYLDKNKATARKSFVRLDRGRDVWVELLQMVIQKVHQDWERKKGLNR